MAPQSLGHGLVSTVQGVDADARGVVVVVLDEADAHAVEAVEDPHEVVAHHRLTEVHEALAFADGVAVAGQQGLGVGLCKVGGRVGGLDLQPDTGEHTAGADLVQDPLESALAEELVAGLPVAVVLVPLAPFSEPPRVDAEDLTARVGGGLDEGHEAVAGGLGPEAVHVVVEADGDLTRGEGGAVGLPLVGSKLCHGLLKAPLNAAVDGGGGGVALSCAQLPCTTRRSSQRRR